MSLVQFTALLTIIGVVFNRFNVSLFALNWQLPHREFFNWKEFLILIAIVTIQLLVYRWIVNRMPILREHPEFKGEQAVIIYT